MRTRSLAVIATIFFVIILWPAKLVTVASTPVDANGNALPESQAAGASEDQEAELAKQFQNPVASLISVPFQSNFDFNMGPNDDGFNYTLNFQPVIPISLGKDYNLIIRTIVPIISQDDVIPGTSQSGLGDIVQSFFLTEKTGRRIDSRFLGRCSFGPVGPMICSARKSGVRVRPVSC